MIRLDKICVWTFIACFALMMWSGSLVKWIDELSCYILLLTGLLDCIVNRRWKAYRPLLLALAVMAFYVIYSTFKGFNTLPYIVMDAIISLKPLAPFMVVLAIKPVLLPVEKKVIRWLAIFNVVEVVVLYFLPVTREYTLDIHIMFLGTTCMVAAIAYYYCSIDDHGKVAPQHMLAVMAMIVIGLGCTRAKYYAEAVLAVFFFLLYKPHMFKGIKPQYWAMAAITVAAVAAVTWNKFSYYFLTGNSDTLDPTVAESFARPVLYATSALILIDHIPFGSGLASFASYASQANYSSLYHEYGISNIYGLSEEMPDFICDAFYPMLAQYGVVGILLFITFLVWAFRPVRHLVRRDATRFGSHMAVSAMIVGFLLIESVASTVPMQPWGMIAMIILALAAYNPIHSTIDNEVKPQYNEREYTNA